MDFMNYPVFFISDIHLDKREPGRIEGFLKFLHFSQEQNASVYILGDLFNFWVGNAQAQWKMYQPLLKKMKAMSKEKKLFFLPGNRDFLFAPYWTKLKCAVLEEKDVLEFTPHRILLSHGDILCTKDAAYQKIRSLLRSKTIYHLSRFLPGFLCLRMGQNLRKASKASIQKKDHSYLSPDLGFAHFLLREKNCNIMLCGHFHSHKILPLASHTKLYILPECKGNVFSFLAWDKQEFQECSFQACSP